MPNKLIKKEIIEKYLLGMVSDNSLLDEIETRLSENDEFTQTLLIIEEDLIEQYLNGLLFGERLTNFEKLYLTSKTRRNKIINIQVLKKYALENIPANSKEKDGIEQNGFLNWFGFSPKFAYSLVVPLILISIFSIWYFVYQKDSSNNYIAQLESLYQNTRPLQSRIIDFKYLPHISLRGEDKNGEELIHKRRIIETKLLELVEQNKTSENFNSLGVFYLTEKQYEKAILQFNESLRISESNTEARSNLGVAYLEKSNLEAQLDEKLKLRAMALEETTKAIKDGDKRPELLFNRALILQAMNIPRQAIEAWKLYLEKDKDSKWADEARKHLKELENSKFNSFKTNEQVLEDFINAFKKEDKKYAWKIHSHTKEVNAQKLLPLQLSRSYLEAIENNNSQQANLNLKALTYIGELEREKNSDIFFSDLADYYSKTDSSQKKTLTEAHKFLNEGLTDLSGSKHGEAVTKLKKSRTLFLSAGNIWEAGMLEVPLAFCLTRTVQMTESNKVIDSVIKFARDKNYKWLLSTGLDWKTSNLAIINETSSSIATGKEALRIAEETENIYEIQRMSEFLSQLHIEIGETRNSLKYLAKIGAIEDKYNENHKQAWRNHKGPSEFFSKIGLYESAIVFGNEFVYIAEGLKSDLALLKLSHSLLANIYVNKGEYDKAEEHIFKLDNLVLSSNQDHTNTSLNVNSMSLKADIKRKRGQCKEAIADYNEVIDYWLQYSEYVLEGYLARKSRLLCLQQNNDVKEVEVELQRIIDLLKKKRLQLADEEFRNSFFHNEQTVYDIAIDFALANGNPKQAFKYSQESKARSLLDYIENGAKVTKEDLKYQKVSEPLSLEQIQSRMPIDSQLIQFAVLPKKIVVWIIKKDSFELVEKEISIEKLNKQVIEYLKTLKEDKNNIESIKLKSNELFEVLIAPIHSKIDKEKSLYVVSDKILHRLPFASLFSTKTNKYLIEDFTITNAPSSTIFILKTESAKEKSQKEKIVSIGNPAFDSIENPHLDNLDSAKKEAIKISELYENKEVFFENNATKDSFLNNFAEADVIHFAGHYVANETYPLNSKLLMAKADSKIENDLRVLEIAKKQNNNLKLVVLSACQTDVEQFYNGEGAIGAARIFLGIGSPIVVASHFEVDSESTANLMINFHNYRKNKGFSVAKSLQKAQVDAIKNLDTAKESPFYWSAFSPTGGYTNY